MYLKLKALLDIQYMTSPICHFPHAVDAPKELQQRRCQMKKTETTLHIAVRGEK